MNDAWRQATALCNATDSISLANGHLLLGNIALRARFFGEAIEHGKEAERVLGVSYGCLELLARAYLANGNAEEAFTKLKRPSNWSRTD